MTDTFEINIQPHQLPAAFWVDALYGFPYDETVT